MSERNALRLGFIGLGLMGAPMTLRLLDKGFKGTAKLTFPDVKS